MSLLELIIMSCAVWYVSFILTQSDGPLGVFKGVREQPQLAILKCIYCTSFWIAIAFYLMLYNELEQVVHIFAICGAAHMLASFTGANYGNQD